MNIEKQIIRIKLDYLQGPIWISDVETGEPLTGNALIDTDDLIRSLNYQAAQLYNSYYELDSHDVACWFNHDKEKAEKDVMLDIIKKIRVRLDEINDGSFVVEDYETDRLKSL